jgi:two-component system response regulator MprA
MSDEHTRPHAQILLIEDDPAIQALVSLGLRYENFEVASAVDGRDGLRLFNETDPDLVILDWMLPGMDGIALCKRIRVQKDTPIVIITARDAISDRVTGLETGADDYLVKPFHIDELLARIRARLRHKIPTSATLDFADLKIDPDSHEVVRARQRINLTSTEYKLLSYFLRHPRQVLSKDQILEEIWGYDFGGDANIVEQYIRSLRQKIGAPPILHTIRGFGYILREEKE